MDDDLPVVVREGAGQRQALAMGGKVPVVVGPSDGVWVDAPPPVDEDAGAYALDGAS